MISFDERSPRWIRIYRGITIALFFIFAAAGFIFGIVDAADDITPLAWSLEPRFWAFPIWTVIGVLVGYIQLVCNMLIIQLLDNVKAIRTMMEKAANK